MQRQFYFANNNSSGNSLCGCVLLVVPSKILASQDSIVIVIIFRSRSETQLTEKHFDRFSHNLL